MKKKSLKEKDSGELHETQEVQKITSKAELKKFLSDLREKLEANLAPPIFVMTAVNHVMSMSEIYEFMDKDIKEVLQEIWVKLSQSGIHIQKPPLLFGDTEAAPISINQSVLELSNKVARFT